MLVLPLLFCVSLDTSLVAPPRRLVGFLASRVLGEDPSLADGPRREDGPGRQELGGGGGHRVKGRPQRSTEKNSRQGTDLPRKVRK